MVDIWDFRRFEEMMNRMFEDWRMPGMRPLLTSGERGEMVPAESRKLFIDLIEADKEVIATAEMPGLEKQDIKINLTEDGLEISAETKHEEKKEEKGYVYKERRSGSYIVEIQVKPKRLFFPLKVCVLKNQ
jgi:HSP20 family protein